MRELAMKRRSQKGSYIHKRWIAYLENTVHTNPPQAMLTSRIRDQMSGTVFDTFLIHTGDQKDFEATEMQKILDRGRFKSFLDRDMQTAHGAPTEQMASALEISRDSVVILSQAFLERKHPRAELAYAFERMQWIRKHYNNK